MFQWILDLQEETYDIVSDMHQGMRPIIHEEMDIEVNHSNHFFKIYLDNIVYVESFKIMEEYEDEETEPSIDVEKPSVTSQPTKPTMRDDTNIKDLVLEAKQKTKKISNKDSSPIQREDVEKVSKSECVLDSVRFEVELVVRHSKHFSTLCLDDILVVESSKIVKKCEDEDQESCILYFTLDKQYKNTLHCMTVLFTMHHPLLGFLISAPP